MRARDHVPTQPGLRSEPGRPPGRPPARGPAAVAAAARAAPGPHGGRARARGGPGLRGRVAAGCPSTLAPEARSRERAARLAGPGPGEARERCQVRQRSP